MFTGNRSFLVFTPGLICAFLAGCAHGGERAGAADADQFGTTDEPAVSADDIARTPSESIERILMTRFPGVWVARTPEGGLSVRIRGASSINSSTEPLYVIDGMATRPGPNGSLTGVHAQDIETIQVLKDAASTAMYGVRGANGVIVIKTKQARD
ncbi:MAG: TonB-dependent receptor plug domain-containing protein [Gemmatimonadetes bacterium]|nr:TonB-dependent receptor plug domain-containing protein [Gemmatimonadota bacterium]